MNVLFSIFFAAGLAGFAYTKMGSRIGYGNNSSVWTFVGFTFAIGFIFFYTFTTYVMHF